MAGRVNDKMAYVASHRYARISAQKVRLLADLIRGKFAGDALDILRYYPNRGARMLEKVVRSAMANAEDQHSANVQSLLVAEVRVDEGPSFRRVRPRARGMAHVIKKRTSHIHVTLD